MYVPGFPTSFPGLTPFSNGKALGTRLRAPKELWIPVVRLVATETILGILEKKIIGKLSGEVWE